MLKVRKSGHPRKPITDIEKWATAFTAYMGIFTHAFPTRSQELLQYMSIIRHAAHCHRGLGWCIYDIKFRRKAALAKTLNWSTIDQQLWLMIFTVSPSVLQEQYALFFKGPQQTNSLGAARGATCNDFNRPGRCFREQCRFSHHCNRCKGDHSGPICPTQGHNDSATVTANNSRVPRRPAT